MALHLREWLLGFPQPCLHLAFKKKKLLPELAPARHNYVYHQLHNCMHGHIDDSIIYVKSFYLVPRLSPLSGESLGMRQPSTCVSINDSRPPPPQFYDVLLDFEKFSSYTCTCIS